MDKSETVKIGNTTFNVKAVKAMKEDEFKSVYKDILKGQDLKKVYKEITGSDNAVVG